MKQQLKQQRRMPSKMIERFLRTTSLKIGLKDLFKNVSEAYEY
jgi:hypothetical protein